MGLDFFFLLRIFVRSYVLVLVVGRMKLFQVGWGVSGFIENSSIVYLDRIFVVGDHPIF